MAEKKNKAEDEVTLSESQTVEEVEEDGDQEGKDDGEEERGGSLKVLSLFWFLPRALFKKKWIWGALSGLVVLGLGCVLIAGYTWKSQKKKEGLPPLQTGTLPERFYEESLSPFFIPLHSESSERLMMVDFSMFWDAVAAIRFKKKELQIREKVYAHLVRLAERKKDLSEKTAYLESEIKKIFWESLGRDDLEVKIKNIKAF